MVWFIFSENDFGVLRLTFGCDLFFVCYLVTFVLKFVGLFWFGVVDVLFYIVLSCLVGFAAFVLGLF